MDKIRFDKINLLLLLLLVKQAVLSSLTSFFYSLSLAFFYLKTLFKKLKLDLYSKQAEPCIGRAKGPRQAARLIFIPICNYLFCFGDSIDTCIRNFRVSLIFHFNCYYYYYYYSSQVIMTMLGCCLGYLRDSNFSAWAGQGNHEIWRSKCSFHFSLQFYFIWILHALLC